MEEAHLLQRYDSLGDPPKCWNLENSPHRAQIPAYSSNGVAATVGVRLVGWSSQMRAASECPSHRKSTSAATWEAQVAKRQALRANAVEGKACTRSGLTGARGDRTFVDVASRRA